jgi:hypothetical protein
MSGQSQSNLPEPFADFGVICCTGSGVGGGVGDLQGAVSVVEPGVGAVSVLDEYFVLGTVPEVVALGKDGVVLGPEEGFEQVVDEGSLARAEVLALGGFTVGAGAGAGVGALAVILDAGAGVLRAGCHCGCSQYPSVVSTVYQLNLNSGTVADSPVRSQ